MNNQLPEETLFHVDLHLTREEFDGSLDKLMRDFVAPAVHCLRGMERNPLPEKVRKRLKLVLAVMPDDE